MKAEDLKGLGLEQEAINKIMDWNGKDIASEQAKTKKVESERDNYKSQLDTATEKLERFKDVDPKEMEATITQLQADLKAKDEEYAAKEAERQFNDTLDKAISTAGGRNAKAIRGLLDLDALKNSKDQTEDIKKALDSVKESDAYLFGSDEPFLNPVGSINDAHGGNDNMGSLASIRAAMGLPAKKKGE